MKFEGFSRVIINAEGEAVTPRKAFELGITPDVGFLRKDGWSLGAPFGLRWVAEEMWKDEWTHEINKGETEWKKK